MLSLAMTRTKSPVVPIGELVYGAALAVPCEFVLITRYGLLPVNCGNGDVAPVGLFGAGARPLAATAASASATCLPVLPRSTCVVADGFADDQALTVNGMLNASTAVMSRLSSVLPVIDASILS